MPLPFRNTSAGRPVVLDTALLPCSFLPASAKETRSDCLWVRDIIGVTRLFSFFGSGREFVDKRILGGFLKDDEFGLGDRHALSLEQQVAEILVTAAPSIEDFDVAVDRFHHSEAYFRATVVQDSVQVIQQHEREIFKRFQPL